MTRVESAGRRFLAAERERRAAIAELTAACADLPHLTTAELARASGLPAADVIAIRLRLETDGA